MKNSNLFYKNGHKRALMHLIVIPTILFIFFLSIEKTYSLTIPFLYLLLISVAQYIRLKKTESLELRIYSRTFFDFLLNLSVLLILTILVIFGLGVGQWEQMDY